MPQDRSGPSPGQIMTFAEGDPDENPWVAGGPVVETIAVLPHQPVWAEVYDRCAAAIRAALPGGIVSIDHVGSTAVPGLAAKPVIDIDLIVPDPEAEADYVPPLAGLGYRLTVRERSWYGHRLLRLERPRVNLHVFGPDCPEHSRHLMFRDWLRARPDERERYGAIKAEAQVGAQTAMAYNRRKEAVVRDIYARMFRDLGWLRDPAE